MSDGEEEPACRICRLEASEAPLLSPCKCQGSIGSVHQGCLLEWLASRKGREHCEVCHTPYQFDNVYANLPTRLPVSVLTKRLVQSVSWVATTAARALLAAFCWVALLPYTVIWLFRALVYSSHNTAAYLSALVIANQSQQLPIYPMVPLQSAWNTTSNTTALPANATAEQAYEQRAARMAEIVTTLGRDTLSGQIVTCAVVIASLALFFLKEWILQQMEPVPAFDDLPEVNGPLIDRPRLMLPVVEVPHNVPAETQPQNAVDEGPWQQEAGIQGTTIRIPDGIDPSGDRVENPPDLFARVIAPLPARHRPGVDASGSSDFSPEAGPSSAASHPSDDEQSYQLPWEQTMSILDDLKHAETELEEMRPFWTDTQLVIQYKRWVIKKNKARRRYRRGQWHSTFYPTSGTLALLMTSRDNLLRQSEEHLQAVYGTSSMPELLQRGPIFEHGVDVPNLSSDDTSDSDLGESLSRLGRQPYILPTPPGPDPADDDLQGHEAYPDAYDPPLDALDLPALAMAEGEDDEDNVDDAWADEPEDDDGGFAEPGMDDIDHILEAVGIRGNVFVLLQTLAAVILIISMILIVGFWLPFIGGRTFVATNGLMPLVLGVINLVRRVTDPIVDFCSSVVGAVFQTVTNSAGTRPASSPSIDATVNHASAGFLQSCLYAIKSYTADLWFRIGRSDSFRDRAICTLIGYGLAICSTRLWYVWIRTQSAPWAFSTAETLRRCGMLVKVTCFMIVELVIFPSLCGLYISFASAPLFPNTTTASRMAYFERAPYSAAFLTWGAGTMAMFLVAQWIVLCRSTLRKGSLFFIRDPKDPDIQPIKDMIESPILGQVSKISKSAALYGALITASGLSLVAIELVAPMLFPLRWDLQGGVSVIPFDYLFACLVVPFSLSRAKPVKTSKRLFRSCAAVIAHQLRLSSFLLGKRRPNEEGRWVRRNSWKALLFKIGERCSSAIHQPNARDCQCEPIWVPSGTLAMVPALDHIKLVPGRPATIPVDANHNPKTEKDRAVLEAYRADGYSEAEWTVLYLPPMYRARLLVALFALWTSVSAFAGLLIFVPILVGRLALWLLTDSPVHDGHTLLLGAYLAYPGVVLGCRWFGAKKKRRDSKHSGRRDAVLWDGLAEHFELSKMWIVLKLFLTGCVLLPILAGACFELHILAPMSFDVSARPVLWLPQVWAYGVLVLCISYGISSLANPPDLQASAWFRGVDKFANRGRDQPFHEYAQGVQDFAVNPLMKHLYIYLATPLLLAVGGILLIDNGGFHISPEARSFWTRVAVWELSFILVNRHVLFDVGRSMWKRYVQKIKDEEYLIERRVLNYASS